MLKTLFSSFFIAVFLLALPASAAETLYSSTLKGPGPDLYYYNGQTRSHFPNWEVYRSWVDALDPVQEVSQAQLDSLPLGKPVTYRPGYPLSFASSSNIYLIDQASVLRSIPNETIATQVWGEHWKSYLQNQPAERAPDYQIGEDLLTSNGASMYQYLFAARTPSYAVGFSSIDRFPHPAVSSILETGLRHYTLQTPLTTAQVENWLKTVSKNDALLYRGTGQAASSQAHPPGTSSPVTFITYGKSTGKTFAHKTVILSPSAKAGLTTLRYMDVTYPEGYLVYPRATTLTLKTNSEEATHVLSTFDRIETIVAWYKTRSTRYGWRIAKIDLHPATKTLNSYGTIYLIRQDNPNHKMIVTIFGNTETTIYVSYDRTGNLGFGF